jgi:hypothetical protein
LWRCWVLGGTDVAKKVRPLFSTLTKVLIN